jgi:hypothetical protein
MSGLNSEENNETEDFVENGDTEDPFDEDVIDEFDVSIQPDVSALKMFRSMSFTPWFAIGEFVDNAITSALKNHARLIERNGKDYQLRINIDFPDEKNQLIIDDNAAGITKTEMRRALRTGEPPEDTSVGLSKHGVGLKAASFWWGSTLTIQTYPVDSDHGWQVLIDISDSDNIDSKAHVVKIPHRGYSGTKVTVDSLWQKTPRAKTVATIKAYLPSIYRTFIGTKSETTLDCQILFERKPLSFSPPELLVAPFWPTKEGAVSGSPKLLWRDDVDITLDSGKTIIGWVGLLKETSRFYSGFFLHYRGKGIAGVAPIDSDDKSDNQDARDAISRSVYKPRRIFGNSGLYPDISIIGEFDITDFGKTITTDSPLWSPDEEAEFVQKLLTFMQKEEKNYVRMAKNYRRRTASKREVEENIKIDTAEVEKVKDAIDGRINHEDPAQESPTDNYLPSMELNELAKEKIIISIKDLEGHEHKLICTFLEDRSRDFLGIKENPSKSLHEVMINLAHPILDGIRIDSETRKLLMRTMLGLAFSEIMLTSYEKHQIRDKMNEILRMMGSADRDE